MCTLVILFSTQSCGIVVEFTFAMITYKMRTYSYVKLKAILIEIWRDRVFVSSFLRLQKAGFRWFSDGL
jgi:hypothetical protein